jgi:hypothetical protein
VIHVGSPVRVVNVLTGDVRDGTVTATKRTIQVTSGSWLLSFSPRTRRGHGECSRWAIVLPNETPEDVVRRWRTADGYMCTLDELRAQAERCKAIGKRRGKDAGPQGASVVPPVPEAGPALCATCLRPHSMLHALPGDGGAVGFYCAACARGRLG